MKKIVILMGIQGSGKSQYYWQYLSDDYVRINLDSLRTRNNEKRALEECFAAGKNIAVDNTNPTRADRSRYIIPAKAHGYHVIGVFMESKLQSCITRNNQREGKERIPAKAIAYTSSKLEMPSFSEGFDELYFVHNDGAIMTKEKWRESDGI